MKRPIVRGIRMSVLAALLFALSGHLFALEWKATELSFATKPFQTTQEVVFEYRNGSSRAVVLLDVQSNCDCLQISAPEKIVAPGATGTIKALFRLGERAGTTERIVTVVTDAAPTPIQLRVRVEVPEIASFEPRTTSWRLDEANAEKIVEVKPVSDVELELNSVRPTNNDFIARLEVIEPGKHYRVHLSPTTTAQPASAAIRIIGKEKGGREVILSVYANVH